MVNDADAFTSLIASGDPEKIVALERGPIKLYWEVAMSYIKRLVAEHERVKKAAKKSLRHGR